MQVVLTLAVDEEMTTGGLLEGIEMVAVVVIVVTEELALLLVPGSVLLFPVRVLLLELPVEAP